MKKRMSILTTLLALLLSAGAGAQQKSQDADKSLLWKISGKELTKTSYLFGTMHLICRDDYVWTDKMKESLNKSEQVCFEMNLNDPKVISESAMALVDVILKGMEKSLSPGEMALIKNMLKDSLLGKEMTDKMHPTGGMNALSGMTGLHCNDAVSYEDSIMTLALADKKNILGLEEPMEQVEALATLPLDSLMNMLMNGNLPDESKSGEDAELTKAYKEQDLPTLYKLVTSSKEAGMDMYVFLDKRNMRWIPRMADKMKTSSVFFAVGAGHLYGPNGVINLLRKAGYTVEPIK